MQSRPTVSQSEISSPKKKRRFSLLSLSPVHSIKGKMTLFTVILMASLSAFIFTFIPAKLEKISRDALVGNAVSIADAAAVAIAHPLEVNNMQEISKVVESFSKFHGLVYIIIQTNDGGIINYHNKMPGDIITEQQLSKTVGLDPRDNVLRIEKPILTPTKVLGTLYLALSLDSLNQTVSDSRRLITFVSLFIFLVGFVGVFVMSSIISRPVRLLMTAAGAVRDGDFHTRVNHKSKDELGNLSDSFNSMVESLESAYQNLESANSTLAHHSEELQQEVSERKRVEVALRESEGRFRAVIEHATDIVAVMDEDSNFIYVSPASVFMLGRKPETIVGTNILELIHPSDRVQVQKSILAGKQSPEKMLRLEARCRHADGTWRYLALRGRNLYDQPGIYGALLNISDVTEARQFQKELVEAKETAEEMVRLKDSFLANMSHEIRTPLTGILGFAQVLDAEVDEEHKELVNFIQEGGKRLLTTLNSVLDLAQLEANSMKLELEEVDLAKEIRQTAQMFLPMARLKKIKLQIDAPSEPVMATVDIGCVNRVLNNLLSNALKFTEDGAVTMRVRGTDGFVRIAVADTGMGIAQEFLPYLFDEFKQESTGVSRSHEGSGLGLAITRKLVRLMHGEITVDSKKGAGTVFTITLPKNAKPSKDLSTAVFSERIDRIPERREYTTSQRKSVLLVEDNQDTQLLVTKILKDEFDVSTASSSTDAIEIAEQMSFDIILMDINLGDGKSGIEVLSTLRQMESCKGVPFVAVTAYALPGDRAKFIKHGFTEYLSKPFRKEELLRVVRSLLSESNQVA